MGQPAAKLGDKVVGTCIHIILIPAIVPVPTPIPHPFNATIDAALSANVNVMKRPAATVGSIAHNLPPHIPLGGPFARPPTNMARIITGSPSVFINGKPVARNTDTALICSDPVDLPNGKVVAVATVLVA